MSDELAKKLAEARKKMLGNRQPVKTTILVRGNIRVTTEDPGVEIKKLD